jgi:uncharacterized protein (TIGR02145 family)
MAVFISSNNFSGQTANVTLYLPTGYTKPYDHILSTSENLGGKVMPFTYQADIPAWEYGTFSLYFSGAGKTCIEYDATPPDGDGNVYRTIQIGNQIWMSENLKTTKFQDGTPLSNTSQVDNATWAAATASNKYWALVSGTTANTQTYGLVYNQFAVTGSTVGGAANNNLCPVGWHVPTNAEFLTLNSFLSANAGTQMKSTTLWASGGNGTNSSGFNGVPPGYRNTNGSWPNFSFYGSFWTSSSGSNWNLNYNLATFDQYTDSSLYGFSVRCLKD